MYIYSNTYYSYKICYKCTFILITIKSQGLTPSKNTVTVYIYTDKNVYINILTSVNFKYTYVNLKLIYYYINIIYWILD